MIPAVILAGGQLDRTFTQQTGVTVKALLPLAGEVLVTHTIRALHDSGVVSNVYVVGNVDALRPLRLDATLLPEGATGIENLRKGMAVCREEVGDGMLFVSACDVPFITPHALRTLLRDSPEDADLVFPIVSRTDYEAAFPGCPNIWTRLAEGDLTGGSVFLMRPSAVERNAALLERAFAARKSQWAMAQLLGIRTLYRFLTRRLTVAEAEAKVNEITGCRCRALVGAPAALAADVDGYEDYLWAQQQMEGSR